jgi:hypothetical protein
MIVISFNASEHHNVLNPQSQQRSSLTTPIKPLMMRGGEAFVTPHVQAQQAQAQAQA